VSLEALARDTDGLTGAQLEAIIEDAAILAIEGYLGHGGDPADEAKVAGVRIEDVHLRRALQEVKREAVSPASRYASAPGSDL
jgi:SpoVK/Ycf46/Vps4 family AAA+-type ATPase